MRGISTALRGLLADVEREEAQLQARLEEVRLERRGLELALRRQQGGDASPPLAGLPPPDEEVSLPLPDAPQPAGDWARLNQTEAVAKVLAEATTPLSAREVADRLAAVGMPQDNTDAVRGGLAYLKRKGRATFHSRGQWVLVDETATTNADAPVAAEASDAVSLRLEGGGADEARISTDRELE